MNSSSTAKASKPKSMRPIRLFDKTSSTPTLVGKKRREIVRISDNTRAEKAKWRRLVEAVTWDYIYMGPEAILTGGGSHRQNLNHRKLRRIIETHYVEFFGSVVPKLGDCKINMVLWMLW
jgi:hypothetical protein